jgi:AraC family transcriptional regulator of adaptative response / DNA-3-methyladenine glycosylase II
MASPVQGNGYDGGMTLDDDVCYRALTARGEIDLNPGVDPTSVVAELLQLPGIGPWTAEYIAMRALRWPDAFPARDLGLVKASRMKSVRTLEQAAVRWRPWRAYTAMHLWQSLQTNRRPLPRSSDR